MTLLQTAFAKTLRFILNRRGLNPSYAVPEFSVRAIEEKWCVTDAGRVRMLLYWPQAPADTKLPVYINLHGGGFIFGQPEHDAPYCRRLAHEAGCLVVNVDYAKSPEHPFPIALHQCFGVLTWLTREASALGIDPARIAVGGNSAGGNLATGVARLARDTREDGKPHLCLQVLNYPPLDLTPAAENPPQENRSKVLNPKIAKLFNACYAPDPATRNDVLVSPGLASVADLTGMPPALIITAELDMLCTAGNAYAQKLQHAGVPVTQRMFSGCDHAFTHLGPQAAADEAWALIASELRRAFSR